MIAPRWRKVVRDLASHKFRTLLVVLSIAVGIFAVGVVMGGRGVLLREFDEQYAASVAPGATFQTEGSFDEHLLAAARRQPGVVAAEARRGFGMRYTTREVTRDDSSAGWQTVNLTALRDPSDVQVRKLTPEEGVWPPGEGEIVLERSAKQVDSPGIGERLTVEGEDGERHLLVVAGYAHDINAFPARFTGQITGFVSPETAVALGEQDGFNRLDVAFGPEVETRTQASELAGSVQDAVFEGSGVRVIGVQVPEPGSHFLGDIFKAVSLLLLAMGVLALALSGFLVVNTVSALMSQQVAQVGIMKAIGGRSAQIMRMYLAMVGAYGVMAVLLGVPVGLIAGRGFIMYAAGVLNFRIASYAPPAWVIALEVAVGLIVPLAAAWVPVRMGSRISVVRALNATGISASSFGNGLLDRALGLLRGLPRPVALSLRNTFLRKGRLLLTLTTLTLASAVVMAVISEQATMLATVDAVDSWWNYDVEVGLPRPQQAEAVEREALQVPEVRAVETWVERGATLLRSDGTENESLFVIGLPADTDFVTPTLTQGRWLQPGEAGAVVVNTDVYKDEPDMRVGSMVDLEVGGVEGRWKIVGVVAGQLMGPVIFADKGELDSFVGANGTVTRLLVKTTSREPHIQERAAIAVERALDDAGMVVGATDTQSGMRARVASQFGILVVFLVIMASLLAAVGVIGLTGTMSINVLESTREIGVMRALGASHRSIYQIFITEGLVVALIAWGLGALASYPLSYALTVLLAGAMNLPLSFTYSWWGVGIWLGSVVGIAFFASLLPAYRASQVSVRDAIAYE